MAAEEFDVDPRVVLAAYQELEREEVLEMRNRSGVYVAPPRGEHAQDSLPASMRQTEWLIDRLAEALARGMPAPSFPEHARRALETLRLRAVVLDRNDDQLWSTADELARDYGFETTTVDLDELRADDPLPPAMRRADLLVTTAPADDVRALVARTAVPLYTVTMCPDLFTEVRSLLSHGPVYFIVSDPRFAARLHTLYAPSRAAKRLRALVYGQDDVQSIPPDAPLYLTRLARERMKHDGEVNGMAELPLLNRVLPDARVFSAESTRELLTFVVRANLAARNVPERVAVSTPPATRRKSRSIGQRGSRR